jgi:uncharacterized protein YndB with AHSA1/START domain
MPSSRSASSRAARRSASSWGDGAPVCLYHGDQVSDTGTVLEYDPPRRLVYSFHPEFTAELRALPHTRVSFTLEPQEGMVKLTLLHDEIDNEELAGRFREGWTAILSSLKTLLETGAPLPWPKPLAQVAQAQPVAK